MNELHYTGKREDLTDDYPLIANHVLDSLGLFSLVSHIERQFGVVVEEEELTPDNFGTIGVMVKFIESKQVP
jgi:acyl carrier protein